MSRASGEPEAKSFTLLGRSERLIGSIRRERLDHVIVGTTGYPEAVQLRLISSQNRPHVKLVGRTQDGSGLVLGGDKGHARILRGDMDPFIKIVTTGRSGRKIKP